MQIAHPVRVYLHIDHELAGEVFFKIFSQFSSFERCFNNSPFGFAMRPIPTRVHRMPLSRLYPNFHLAPSTKADVPNRDRQAYTTYYLN